MKHNKASFVVAMKSIATLYSRFKWPILVSFIFIIGAEILSLLTPLFVGRIVDAITHSRADMLTYALYVLLAEIGTVVFAFIHVTIDLKFIEYHSKDFLVKNTMTKLFGFSIGQITHEHSGYLQSIIAKGEGAIIMIVKSFFQEFLPTMVKITVTLGGLFYFSTRIGLLALATATSFISLSLWFNLRIKKDNRTQQGMESRNQQWYSDVIRNLRLILLNAQQKTILAEQDRRYDELGTFARKLWLGYNATAMLIREPVSKIFFFVMLVSSVHLYQTGGLKLGEFVMMASWEVILFRHFEKIGIIQRRCINEYPSIYKYFEVLSVQPLVVVAKNPTRPQKLNGQIEFRNVSFSYPAESEDSELGATIKNMSLTFAPGKTYAIVGQSGAGKSTLIALLQRAYDPDQGEILVDGIDLRLIDLDFYRRKIGYVEQEIKLWDDTIRYNILFGLNGQAKHVTDAQLDAVAEQTCITEFYNRLGPKRFDTVIGENGIQLSGGQRQRVGIARALIKDPQILIFDEATNSLDNISDALIQKAMRQALQGRTGIIIAHRLSTVRHADQIIVMGHGEVAGIGTHDELLENCQQYIDLVEKEGIAVV